MFVDKMIDNESFEKAFNAELATQDVASYGTSVINTCRVALLSPNCGYVQYTQVLTDGKKTAVSYKTSINKALMYFYKFMADAEEAGVAVSNNIYL